MNTLNSNCDGHEAGSALPKSHTSLASMPSPVRDGNRESGRQPVPRLLEQFPNVFQSLQELTGIRQSGLGLPSLIRAAPIALRIRETYSVWRFRSRSRIALARMSQYEMRDLGLTVSQITAEASKPFWRK